MIHDGIVSHMHQGIQVSNVHHHIATKEITAVLAPVVPVEPRVTVGVGGTGLSGAGAALVID